MLRRLGGEQNGSAAEQQIGEGSQNRAEQRAYKPRDNDKIRRIARRRPVQRDHATDTASQQAVEQDVPGNAQGS